MINLLPRENKILTKKEYLRRLFVVAGVFLVCGILISAAFLVPMFFLFVNYRVGLEEQLPLSSQGLETEDVISEVKELNFKINTLKDIKNGGNLILIIKEILEMKTEKVKLTSFNYEELNNKEGSKIFLSGTIDKRQDLIAFVDWLKKKFGSDNVLSPVSNLLGGKDAEFSLTVLIPYNGNK